MSNQGQVPGINVKPRTSAWYKCQTKDKYLVKMSNQGGGTSMSVRSENVKHNFHNLVTYFFS